MPVTSKSYCPENFVCIDGINYSYIQTLKLKCGQTKEYYKCEFCGARLHVFKDTLKCQLMRAHTSQECAEARKKWEEKGKNTLGEGDVARLESILEETASASFMAVNNNTDEEEDEDDEPSRIFDLTDATIIADESNNITLTLAMNDQRDTSELEPDTMDLTMARGEDNLVLPMNDQADTSELELSTSDLSIASGDETMVLARNGQTDMSELDITVVSTISGDERMMAESTESGVSSADVYEARVPVSILKGKSQGKKTFLAPIRREPALQDGFYAPTPRKCVTKAASNATKTSKHLIPEGGNGNTVTYAEHPRRSTKKVRFSLGNN